MSSLERKVTAILVAFVSVALPACQGPTPVMVERVRLVIDGPSDGRLRIRGLPGAVLGSVASTVTLTVTRDSLQASPAPTRYTLHHFGAGLAIHSTYAVIDAAGGFAETTLGSVDRAILPGDELILTLYRGIVQQGFTLTMPVTWRP